MHVAKTYKCLVPYKGVSGRIYKEFDKIKPEEFSSLPEPEKQNFEGEWSQNDEQGYITSYFGNHVGKFIEIGGYHPFVFSNTRRLVEKGWNGVYVEPSAPCFAEFVKEYHDNKSITLVNVAISGHNGKITFWDSQGDAISTTDPSHKKIWEEGYKVPYKETQVDCQSMQDFLKQYGQHTDFFNLDVEGANIALFNLVPDWFWQQVKLVCIEFDGQADYIENKLKPFGFHQIARNGENIILCK